MVFCKEEGHLEFHIIRELEGLLDGHKGMHAFSMIYKCFGILFMLHNSGKSVILKPEEQFYFIKDTF